MPQVLKNYDGLMFKVGFSQMRCLTQWKNLLHHKLALNEWNNIFINLSVNNKFPSFWGRQKMLNHSSASEEFSLLEMAPILFSMDWKPNFVLELLQNKYLSGCLSVL